jgi:hypothetical protein
MKKQEISWSKRLTGTLTGYGGLTMMDVFCQLLSNILDAKAIRIPMMFADPWFPRKYPDWGAVNLGLVGEWVLSGVVVLGPFDAGMLHPLIIWYKQ